MGAPGAEGGASLRRHRVAVIPGDGTGPEVVREGLKVLRAAASGFVLDTVEYDLGGARYLRTGETLPDSVLEELREVDAIYLGAVGHPDVPPGVLERDLLLRIRFELDQYVNLRPVRLLPGVRSPVAGLSPEDVDLVFVRENTEGLYVGAGGFHRRGTREEVAVQESVNTRRGVERCLRYAFGLARRPDRRGHVTLVHKTNVLTFAGDLWWRAFREVAEEFPGVETAYVHVDAACIYLVEDPRRFDVVVTDNMFGDILTDLAAVVQGGMGVAAGANLNPEGVSMFEPIGGTAPDHAGRGTINPLAAILAGALMLQELGEVEAARRVEGAVRLVAPKLRSMRAGEMGFTTSEVGDLVAEAAAP
ncbi:MAG TPA: 3-isopropylmalate dehydrogenase [Actinomycetota bacterium]|nr:3-isopropylmalate dehydrogenase [Actinomycetota bacterium]